MSVEATCTRKDTDHLWRLPIYSYVMKSEPHMDSDAKQPRDCKNRNRVFRVDRTQPMYTRNTGENGTADRRMMQCTRIHWRGACM